MRKLKYLFESIYTRKHSKNENFIKSIWFLTEDEIFESFTELHDSMDVSISVNFYLKGKNFECSYENKLEVEEKIEAYAAAGLKPSIMVTIVLNNPTASQRDNKKMHAYAMESLHHIEDYSVYDIKRGNGHLKIYLSQDDNSEKTKSLYHKRSARSFKELLNDFRKIGYTPTVSRNFFKNGKLNLMYSPESLKLYYITLEKVYKIELEMIDDLYNSKNKFKELVNNLNQLPDITYVDENFDIINSTRVEISIVFTLYAWEK